MSLESWIGGERKQAIIIFEQTMAENFPKLSKDIRSQSQETNLIRKNIKEITLGTSLGNF